MSCPLNICSTFWKHFTGEELSIDDVGLIDENSLTVVETIQKSNESCFASDLTWSSHLSDNRNVELIDYRPAMTLQSAKISLKSDDYRGRTISSLVTEEGAKTYARRLFS